MRLASLGGPYSLDETKAIALLSKLRIEVAKLNNKRGYVAVIHYVLKGLNAYNSKLA
jgi:hypothetical protein